MPPDTLALILALAHHLLVFSLVAVAAMEFAILSRDLEPILCDAWPCSTRTTAPWRVW